MGSNINFKNFGDAHNGEGNGGRLAGNFSLARQTSVYSLTFDEFQNTMGGLGKDFGSMNMDELLKNIWTAEEIQGMTSTCGAGEGNAHALGGNLQRQGSLTLPRTLSQKTVDDVWKELIRENSDAKFGIIGGVSNLPQEQRQQTLGEMTLEEFLARAGVVKEDAEEIERPNTGGFFGELLRLNNHTGLAPGFQQPSQNNGHLGNRAESNNNSVHHQSPSLALNVGGVRTSQKQTHQLPPQQQAIYPKPATLAFSPSMHLVSNAQLTSPRTRGPVAAVVEPSRNTTFSQGGGFPGAGVGMGGVGARGVTVASPVNQMSPDVTAKSSADASSLSPVPYMFTRGRKANGALEKVVERRQRRMIKNRESAARSRARKQAYTLELEAEVAKLKEMNEELQRKQAEIVEMQKDQILETMKRKWGGKKQCLRRTLTGPW